MGRGPVIQGKKEASSQARGKVYSIHAKLIALAAQRGADIALNSALANAVTDAKKDSVPNDIIDRAIKRGAGLDKEAKQVEEIFYEGYAAGGVAIIVRALTDNKNRTAPNMRHNFSAFGGNLGETGSVSGFAFRHQGSIIASFVGMSSEQAEEIIIDSGAADYLLAEDGSFKIATDPTELMHVVKYLQEKGAIVSKHAFEYVPTNPVEVTDFDKALKIYKLLEALEEDDDVEAVWNNAEFDDALMQQVHEAVEKARFRT